MKIYLLFLLATTLSSFAAFTTILIEGFGDSDSRLSLENEGGLDNNNSVEYLSIEDADVRTSGGSAGQYPDATGGNNVFLTDNTEGFLIYNINANTASYGAYLSVGFATSEAIKDFSGMDSDVFKVYYTSGSDFAVSEASVDSVWAELSYSSTSNNGASGWVNQRIFTNPTPVIIEDGLLHIKFMSFVGDGVISTNSTHDIRVDDVSVTLSTVPEPSTYALLLGGAVLGYVFWRRK